MFNINCFKETTLDNIKSSERKLKENEVILKLKTTTEKCCIEAIYKNNLRKYKYYKMESYMEFRNFLDEQELIESAGNLKGMPTLFIKKLVQHYGGLGGKGSNVQLWKANAKQKDLTAAAKMCGGWVKPSEKGYRRYSRKEVEAQANKKNFAGVVVKVNGEWAFMASWDEYTQDGGNYQITATTGDKTVKRANSYMQGRGIHRKMVYTHFDSKYLKANEIGNIIDFEEDTVDVYVVTTDPDRIILRQEREANRAVSKVSPARKKAIVKFLEAKSGGIISQSNDRLQKIAKEISDSVGSILNDAIKGKEKSIDAKALTDKITKEIESASSLAYYIRDMVESGNVKNTGWRDTTDTWAYKKFKELAKEMNDKDL